MKAHTEASIVRGECIAAGAPDGHMVPRAGGGGAEDRGPGRCCGGGGGAVVDLVTAEEPECVPALVSWSQVVAHAQRTLIIICNRF